LKTTYYFLVCSFFLILFTSCNKCEQHQTGFLTLTPDDLTINPYTGNELIIFKNLNGDSAVFDQGNRIKTIETQYQYAPWENNGCRGDYVELESNNTTFKSINTLWKFSIMLSFDYHFPDNGSARFISFKMSSDQTQNYHGYSDRELKYDVDTLYNRIYLTDTAYQFHRSLTLGKNSFNNVYEIKLIGYLVSDELAIILYYSIPEGIVGFITNRNENWYLDN
jgi:hypothetical protein